MAAKNIRKCLSEANEILFLGIGYFDTKEDEGQEKTRKKNELHLADMKYTVHKKSQDDLMRQLHVEPSECFTSSGRIHAEDFFDALF